MDVVDGLAGAEAVVVTVIVATAEVTVTVAVAEVTVTVVVAALEAEANAARTASSPGEKDAPVCWKVKLWAHVSLCVPEPQAKIPLNMPASHG